MPGDEPHVRRAEAHRAAHVLDVLLLGQQVDDRVRRLGVELGGVGAGHAADVARELGHGALHAQADAEERDLVLAAVLDGLDLALDAALAEAAGHDDAVRRAQPLLDRRRRDLLGVDPRRSSLRP